jgi:DMATS type aromatic prenyltransferase
MAQTLCDSVARRGFVNQDQEFRWRATAPSLGYLLASCQYSEEDQLSHLSWYRRFIISALGLRPIPGKKPRFQPCPVFDGSACELSINFKERSPDRTVRFTIEVIGFKAGTAADPFNQDATKNLLRAMAAEMPGLDLQHFDTFVDDFFLPPEVAETLVPLVPAGTPPSQVWLALNLHCGKKIIAEVYFMPVIKWIHTGALTTMDLVFATARKCSGKHGAYKAPTALLDSYLESVPRGEGPLCRDGGHRLR